MATDLIGRMVVQAETARRREEAHWRGVDEGRI